MKKEHQGIGGLELKKTIDIVGVIDVIRSLEVFGMCVCNRKKKTT